MQEKPPFSSYLDFFSLTYGRATPSHTHPAYFDFAFRHAPGDDPNQVFMGQSDSGQTCSTCINTYLHCCLTHRKMNEHPCSNQEIHVL